MQVAIVDLPCHQEKFIHNGQKYKVPFSLPASPYWTTRYTRPYFSSKETKQRLANECYFKHFKHLKNSNYYEQYKNALILIKK
jgi:hypothetical protein